MPAGMKVTPIGKCVISIGVHFSSPTSPLQQNACDFRTGDVGRRCGGVRICTPADVEAKADSVKGMGDRYENRLAAHRRSSRGLASPSDIDIVTTRASACAVGMSALWAEAVSRADRAAVCSSD